MGKVSGQGSEMTFWDHLDDLRSVMFKGIAVFVAAAATLFAFMPWIFDNVILAPCRGDFITYRLFDRFAAMFHDHGSELSDFHVELINIQLASQFFIHMSSSCWLALAVTFPVLIYLMWGFVKPGLYEKERRGSKLAFMFGNLMFYTGMASGYFLVFPLAVRFLSDYQLSPLIPNQISIDSYMDTFVTLILVMGMVFELPLLAWLLGRTGLLSRSFFNRYRRHAIVALLVLAAVITPTGDPFTLFAVFIPIYLLWELSSFMVPSRTV